MITELYEHDRWLVDNIISNNVTFEIRERGSDGTWSVVTPLPYSQIVSESMELKQSICDDRELRIGGCIPSQLSLSVIDTGDLTGKRIVAKISTTYYSDVFYPSAEIYPSDTLYPYMQPVTTDTYTIFIGTVYSCKKSQSNPRIRKLCAFDRMHEVDGAYCKNKVYNYLKSKDTADFTFGDFYLYFRAKFKCGFVLNATNCVNWNEILRMVDDTFFDVADKKTTYLSILQSLCEMNGIFLIDDMPSNETSSGYTPRVIKPYENVSVVLEIPTYTGLKYDEYKVKDIHYVRFPFYDDKYSANVTAGEVEGYSRYYSDNPLINSFRIGSYVKKLLSNLAGISGDKVNRIIGSIYAYRPFKVSIYNRWWIQCGDRVKLPVADDPDLTNGYVESIILSRTIKGISNLSVTIEAKGVEILGKESDDDIE